MSKNKGKKAGKFEYGSRGTQMLGSIVIDVYRDAADKSFVISGQVRDALPGVFMRHRSDKNLPLALRDFVSYLNIDHIVRMLYPPGDGFPKAEEPEIPEEPVTQERKVLSSYDPDKHGLDPAKEIGYKRDYEDWEGMM